jgi:hypothetical protein
MPFYAIQEYDAVTALNNSDIAGNNIAEGCAPSGINNALRDLCKQLRQAVANQGADIASAATTNIGAATGQYVRVTGTTTITSLGTVNAGAMRWVEFAGSLTLTNGANIILPGGANIVTQAGDVGLFVSRGAGVWKLLNYQPGNQAIRACFRAHKNNVDQTGIATATWTKLTFGTEEFDIGGYYDAAISRWTPPPGKYVIQAQALPQPSGLVAGQYILTDVYKNGAAVCGGVSRATGANAEVTSQASVVVDANGTDYFEIFFYHTKGSNHTVLGDPVATWFQAWRIA